MPGKGQELGMQSGKLDGRCHILMDSQSDGGGRGHINKPSLTNQKEKAGK